MTEKPAPTIRITCPGCGDIQPIPDKGERVTRIRCKRCKTIFALTDRSQDRVVRERDWMLAEGDDGVVVL